jgi:hypothetical protein
MSTKFELLRWRKFQGIPPKSTNSLYDKNTKNQQWYKTYPYRLFRQAMLTLLEKDSFLPSCKNEWKGHGLYIDAGIIKEFDLDNTLKGIIDALQENYGFNDSFIQGIIAKKTPIGSYPLPAHKWSDQYITIGFIKYADIDCNVFTPSEFKAVESKEITAPIGLTNTLFRSVSADTTNVKNSGATSTAVYPMPLYPNTELAAQYLQTDVETLENEMRKHGANYKIEEHLCKIFAPIEGDVSELKRKLSNKIDKDEYNKLMAGLLDYKHD